MRCCLADLRTLSIAHDESPLHFTRFVVEPPEHADQEGSRAGAAGAPRLASNAMEQRYITFVCLAPGHPQRQMTAPQRMAAWTHTYRWPAKQTRHRGKDAQPRILQVQSRTHLDPIQKCLTFFTRRLVTSKNKNHSKQHGGVADSPGQRPAASRRSRDPGGGWTESWLTCQPTLNPLDTTYSTRNSITAQGWLGASFSEGYISPPER